MSVSVLLKGAALATTVLVGAAIAQSNPPNTSAADPAQGAGQRSSQDTPMGTTGTPTNNGTTSSTAPAAAPATTAPSGSSMNSTTSSSTTTTDTSSSMANTAPATPTPRADRN